MPKKIELSIDEKEKSLFAEKTSEYTIPMKSSRAVARMLDCIDSGDWDSNSFDMFFGIVKKQISVNGTELDTFTSLVKKVDDVKRNHRESAGQSS